jgi:hypothetical protein
MTNALLLVLVLGTTLVAIAALATTLVGWWRWR